MERRADLSSGATTVPRDGFSQADGTPAIPIVLGVVGHRDVRPEALGILQERLVELFLEFQKAYPKTPLVVVTSLAQGADQIAARAALEAAEIVQKDRLGAGVFVRAPLPFEPGLYRQSTTFDTDEARDELDRLLAHPAVEAFEVALATSEAGRGADWARVASDRSDETCATLRHSCYAEAGWYTARHCHALVALWDEQPSMSAGGTAEHVALKLEGIASKTLPAALQLPLGYRGERGLVVSVYTPRLKNPPGAIPNEPAPGRLRVLVPREGDRADPLASLVAAPEGELPLAKRSHPMARFWGRVKQALGNRRPHHSQGPKDPKTLELEIRDELRQFRDMCTTVDDFNGALQAAPVAERFRQRLANRRAPFEAEGFGERENRWLARIGRIREASAASSDHIESRLWWTLPITLSLIFVGVVLFHFYAHHFELDTHEHHTIHSPVLLQGFVLCLAAAIGVVVWEWWTRAEERRQDGRGLAEALRVRHAWASVGLGRSVADSYVGQLRSEVSWIRQALFHACPPPAVWDLQWSRLRPEEQRSLLQRARVEWVSGRDRTGGQYGYFLKRHGDMHRAAVWYRRLGLGLAILGWGLLALLIFSGLGVVGWSPIRPEHWVLIASSLLVIAGGLLVAYCERRSFEDLAHQYERMRLVFDNGDHVLAERLADGDLDGARAVLEALGVEAILEHSQWLILRRARPLELHIGA